LLAWEGLAVTLAARDSAKLEPLRKETGTRAIRCDARDQAQVAQLFDEIDRLATSPDVVVYNAGARMRGPLVELVPEELQVTADGTSPHCIRLVRRALPRGETLGGCIPKRSSFTIEACSAAARTRKT
jgi:NADP-dependent 3-hydroxy acid dehydrogenase YdfG